MSTVWGPEPAAPLMPFRYDDSDHSYTLLESGEERPHITGMLEQTGWIDRSHYTEESSDRGVAIHYLTRQYDFNLLTVDRCTSPFVNSLRAYAGVATSLRWEWRDIEVPRMHPHYLFGGRPDRVGIITRLQSVLEIKSGQKEKAHQIQTALQAILVSGAAGSLGLAEAWHRFAIYLKPNGRAKVEHHQDRRDLDEAYSIIRKCC